MNRCSPRGNVSFIPGYFKGFFIGFRFQKFNYNVSWGGIWGVVFHVFIFSASSIFRSMSFANVKNAQPLFFKIFFQSHFFYPFLLGSNDINVGSFVIRSLGVCSFIFGSNQVNSFNLSFSSLITFTVTQLCSSSNKFLLIYVIIFFSLIIFIWLFTTASNYLSKFSIF